MATFTYSVRDTTGGIAAGSVSAESRIDAMNLLRNRGLFVIDISEQEAETVVRMPGFGGGFFQNVKLDELSIFFKQLAAMLGAGIAITRCLQTLAKQQKNAYFSRLLLGVMSDVSSGLALSAAMSKYPRVFNPMVISLLVAAEETGTLDTTMEQLATAFEAEVALRHQVSAGMRYPLIVAVAALLVVVFVMIFVVPQFEEIFKMLGNAKLPFMTQIVLFIGTGLKRFWFFVPIIFIGFPWVITLINSNPAGRLALDQIKLMTPVFGDLNKKIILARMSKVFSTMLSAGVPILKTLNIVEQTSLNAVYEKAFAQIRAGVKEGRAINGPMENHPNLFPPMVHAMVAVGEESGTLDHMLLKINHFYTVEIEATVKKLTALLEPVMIGTLGVIVGFIVIALWMPLFKVIQLIQQLK
jgi:type IV pilus assembly protein PilC